MTTAADVVSALADFEFHYSDEDMLQEGIAAALTARGFEVCREVRLNSRDRIDLVVERIGIEVKIAGGAPSVRRQCDRYLKSEAIDEVILVSTRPRHAVVATPGVTVLTLLTPW